MAKYLFGAEADSIQNTLFRVAAQRQVVGGSRLLVEFGRKAKELASSYGATEEDILVTSGGNFRILFPAEADAKSFGRKLADCYRLLMDASITVAQPKLVPEPVNDNFPAANQEIGNEIRRLKRSQRGAGDTAHAPTTAFCLSSGIGLADRFDRLSEPQSEQYLSTFAWRTAQAGNIRWEKQQTESHLSESDQETEENGEEDEDSSFLGEINNYLARHEYFGEEAKSRRWANVDDVASIDGERSNVAYLVADGNNMGKMFSECKADELERLSKHLDKAVRQALATSIPADEDAPIVLLVKRLREARRIPPKNDKRFFFPLLPLILAGDEVFILLPAVYALDFARRFCLAFEHFMRQSAVVDELCKARQPPPTLGAAVVFCKGSYPYKLAHQHGSALLKQAKQLAKIVGQETKEWHSTLIFDQIIGSERMGHRETLPGDYRPTLAPYWISQGELGTNAQRLSLDLADLLLHRRLMNGLPNKRLAELRELFALENLPDKDGYEARKPWNDRLGRLLDRIDASGSYRSTVEHTLTDLGNRSDKEKLINPGHWRPVNYPNRNFHYGHGLPDLISIWEYAQSLDNLLSEYEEKENNAAADI